LTHSQDVDLFEKIKAELLCYSTEEACAQLIKEIDCHLEELVKSKNENDLKIKSERIQILIKSINDLAVSDFSFKVDRYDGLKQKEHVYENKICCQLSEKINEGFKVLSEAIKKIAGKNCYFI